MEHKIFGDYVLTRVRNAFNDRDSYWISKRNSTLSLYCFTPMDDRDLAYHLEHIDAYIEYFDNHFASQVELLLKTGGVNLSLPDGSELSVVNNRGWVGRDVDDTRTYQDVTICRKSPDGMTDVLCSVDYEDDLGIRVLVYDSDGDDYVFEKHVTGPDGGRI